MDEKYYENEYKAGNVIPCDTDTIAPIAKFKFLGSISIGYPKFDVRLFRNRESGKLYSPDYPERNPYNWK